MIAIVIDTETTGLIDPEPIEVAWMEVEIPLEKVGALTRCFSARYKPTKPISCGAMATHHIHADDLQNCVPFSEFVLPEVNYLVGHNIDFDAKVLGANPSILRICTCAISRRLWPEADSHSLSALLYFHLGKAARELLTGAHAAADDVWNTRRLLRMILKKTGITTWAELWQFSEAARIPLIMPFGKHRGVPIEQVPPDYKRWLLGQDDLDPYLAQALKT